MKFSFPEQAMILIFGIFIAFKNILFGVWLLPQVVATTSIHYLPFLLCLGILGEGVLVCYFSLKLAGVLEPW